MNTIIVPLAQAVSEYAGTVGGGGGTGGSFQMPEVSLTAWLVAGGALLGTYLFTRLM